MPVAEAEPYPVELTPSRTAYLIIDMQRDFLEPGGFGETLGNDVAQLRPALGPCRAMLDEARARGLLVIHTREGHRPDLTDAPPAKLERGKPSARIGDAGPMGRILVDGQPGNDIVPELAPSVGETVIVKPGKGAFYATRLDELLRSQLITHLILAGVTTEVCVQTTMREANDRGYECLLVEDATESYFAEFKQATLAMVHAQGGIVGWTAPFAAVRAALP